MNEQQRTMLRKSGKQLFMDEIDQLTTNEAGHTDVAEIGILGQSELSSTCELLGGRTLRHEILDVTCRRVKGVPRQLRDYLRDSLLVPSFLCVVVSVAMERQGRQRPKQTRTCATGDAIAGHRRSLRVGVASRLSGVGAV